MADVIATSVVRPSIRTRRPIWLPILTGESAAAGQAAIDAIERDLNRRAESLLTTPDAHASLALLLAYLNQARFEPARDAQGMEFLERAVIGLGEHSLAPSLHGGFSGIAWTVAHLSSHEQRVDDEQFSVIDEALDLLLSHSPDDVEFDLITGLVGLGVYALERLPSPVAARLLEQVIERLDRSSVDMLEGTTWRTPVERLPPQQRHQFPRGICNLGVAHGVPGVIGLLARTIQNGVAVDTATRLLRGAVSWLLVHQFPGDSLGAFGYYAAPGYTCEVSRLAWCYGDLSIAVVLLNAARALEEPLWERTAREIGTKAAARTFEQSGVQDAGLCHGAAGVAHLFNRLYQATGDDGMLSAARRWIDHTLALRSDERGVGGFAAMQTRGPQAGQWADDASFLEGAIGVALALTAATCGITPDWDRLLLATVAMPPE